MTGSRRFAALLIAALLPTSVLAADDGERLVSPASPTFVVGYEAANTAQSIREEVPKGETVEAWTRMITTQRLGGLVSRATPAAFAARIAVGMTGSCPGAIVSPVTETTVSGHAAARMQADCPMNKGQPESFILLAVAGETDMHVKQAAVRGPGAATKLAWGDTLLAKTALCSARSAEPVCRIGR